MSEENAIELSKAVAAFLNLKAYQIPEFCRLLSDEGIFVNIGIAHLGGSQLVGGPAVKPEEGQKP